jgi:hypothetical protein
MAARADPALLACTAALPHLHCTPHDAVPPEQHVLPTGIASLQVVENPLQRVLKVIGIFSRC